MDVKTRHQKLIRFVLDQAELQPARARADLYMALAEVCGEKEQATRLRNMAKELAKTDALCREFAFCIRESQAHL